ncbi:MAG: DUF1566 domain-containing protein [Candidatus Nitrotoga sp.]
MNPFNNKITRPLQQLVGVLLVNFFLVSWGGVYAATLADISPGNSKSRFTRVSAPDSKIDSCVQDHVTGLMWEVKTADGGLRDWNKRYSNFDNTAAGQFWTGSDWVNPTQAQIDAPSNSVGFKNNVNAQGLCGFHDWRLPTLDELQSILDTSRAPRRSPTPTLTIDTNWFPNTQVAAYWSASPGTDNPTSAWYVYFGKGGTFKTIRPYNYFVRLVRGGH